MVKKHLQVLINQLRDLEPDDLLKVAIQVYNNAVELIEEALILVGHFSYARAFFLSFSGFEELGKGYFVSLLSHQLLAESGKGRAETIFNALRGR